MNFQPATEASAPLVILLKDAERRLRSHRGGPELLETILAGATFEELVDLLVARGELWVLTDEETARGFAIVRRRVVEAIFVESGLRRTGAATTMLRALLATGDPPIDAYALPGDRAMKSVFESIGWKARLLTMRGE